MTDQYPDLRRGLLAWEIGGALGHVFRMHSIARALDGVIRWDAALCNVKHGHHLSDVCELVFKAPAMRRNAGEADRASGSIKPGANFADMLGLVGFADQQRLRSQVIWWLNAFRLRQTEIVIADHAPCALLAARIAKIPAFMSGNAYHGIPSHLDSFPVLLPGRHPRRFAEADLTETVNCALGPLGLPRINQFAEIFTCSGELVHSIALLDPYQAIRRMPLLPPVKPLHHYNCAESDEVFAYFYAIEPDDEGIIEAICECPGPRRVYIATASDAQRSKLRASGVVVEDAPVAREHIARRSRLLISEGSPGIATLGVAAGIPQVLLPTTREKRYNAQRLTQAGVAHALPRQERTAARLSDLIQSAYRDPALATRSKALAHDHIGFFEQNADDNIRERVGAALAQR